MRFVLVVVVVIVAATAVAADPPAKAVEANTRGMRLYAKKDYKPAAAEFRTAIALDDGYVLARYNLASMAALLHDKPTVLEQLRWLRSSRDPYAATVLAKAKTDPDLKSIIDDPDVRKIVESSAAADPANTCESSCRAKVDSCANKCGDSRGCLRLCEWGGAPCRDGCALGMTPQGTARMQAWLDGPLTGRDNDVANYRDAKVVRTNDATEPTGEYTAFIKNQFGFTCVLGWSPDGDPLKLSACKSAMDGWTATPAEIAMRCQTETKPKQETCKGGFQLVKDGFVQPAELVLRRAIK